MSDTASGAALPHLPSFITAPGESDALFTLVAVSLVVVILALGALYFRLHALPEHMAHRAGRAQYQLVAILALIALFTHNNLFWIAALLLAAVQLPDVMTPLRTIAASLERIAYSERAEAAPEGEAPDIPPPPAEDAPERGTL